MLVATPRIRNSASARRARAHRRGKSRAAARELRRASSRSAALICGARSGRSAVEADARAARRAVRRDPPGVGPEPGAGSSVVMRHCSAAPRELMSSWLQTEVGEGLPAAIRICDCTRSTSVTSSVTVCSTWMRGFTSMKHVLRRARRVEQELDGARVHVADRPRERDRRRGACAVAQLVGRGSAPARSR